MVSQELRTGTIVSGPVLPEPIEILAIMPLGDATRVIGRGLQSGLARDIVLSPAQIAQLVLPAAEQAFDGDAHLFRLGVEAQRLGLAYEYDPFFSLSIARVDPLPHQLEAVYEYFLKLPRIRFLLADDPGAGKTIMAGLLLKEMKARGLVRRTLIVAPANLTFQWQRELKDKFSESFEVMRGDVLRANYGQNPWQERSQVVTSLSWVSRIDDAKDSLLRSRWDLIIVDEAHKMAAYADDRKTLAFKLGEALSVLTDHYLLMTATPHKGDPKNFCLFLSLLDRDVYGSVESLEEAMRRNSAPFYLRRTKEALVSFPDPQTGTVHKLFTKREVRTAAFELDGPELDFYDALSHYVQDQSILASQDDSARGRAVGFTMAMLQRRMASTVYAVRRTLERMKGKREQILTDPEKFRRDQIDRRLPDDFDDLTEEEQQEIIAQLEDVVASYNPDDLRSEIAQLAALIDRAKRLEHRQGESKLVKLKAILTEQGVFSDPKTKLLIFTEHKDSLDFLVGDGEGGRPLGRLRAFANADGGTLVLGVDDDDHIVTGHGYPDDVIAEIFAVPSRRLRPPVECAHQRITIDGNEALVLQVGIATEAVMVEANGFPYRVGDQVVREPQEVINARKEAYRRVGFERQIRADATLADIDLELAQRFLERTIFRDRPIESILERYGLTVPSAGSSGITNACLLLFGKDPLARWHPRAGVRLFHVSGRERTHGTKRNVNQIGRVEGPLAAAIESTYKLAKEQIRQSERLHDLFFKEVPEYPEFAWQEAIVNAFAHRDYQDQAREIEVWFYDDRMEVTNPGDLIPPITVDLLQSRTSSHASRNPLIVRVLADAGLMREEGEGIPRMFDEMEASLLKLPELAVRAGQFMVMLRNDPIFVGPSSEWQRIIESLGLPVPQKRILLAHPDGFTNEDFRRLNGVDRDAAYRTIQEMVAGGIVMPPDSAGRGATYRVNPDLVAARAFLTARVSVLVRQLQQRPYITNADYRVLFGVTRFAAVRELRRLVEDGFLRLEGQRRGSRYTAGHALPDRSRE